MRLNYLILSLVICLGTSLDVSPAPTPRKKTQQTQQQKKNTTRKQTAAKPKKSSPSQPQSGIKQAKQQQEAVQREVAQTKKAIVKNDAEIKKSLSDLQILQDDINSAQNKEALLTKELNTLNSNIAALESQISSAEVDLQRMRDQYMKAVKKMRLAKKQNSNLAFIFSSKNFNQALRRLRYLKQFSEWREKQTRLISAKVAQLRKSADLLAQNQRAKSLNMRQQQQVRHQLESDKMKKDALVVELRKNGEALQNHLAQKQREANALRNQVSALIAQEEAARQAKAEKQRQQDAQRQAAQQRADEQRRQEELQRQKAQQALADARKKQTSPATPTPTEKKKKKTSAPAVVSPGAKESGKPSSREYADARRRAPRSNHSDNAAPSKQNKLTVPNGTQSPVAATLTEPSASSGSSFDKLRGQLPRPVAGAFRVKSPFGPHPMPGLSGITYDNPGIDIETSPGAAVRAVFGGKVSGVYKVPGFGSVVIVSHGNYYTVYGNLSSVSVGKGDTVKQNQSVGKAGTDSDNPQHGELHFEVWKNREKLNPMTWIK